jgi:glycosyltransferase involved in cell wall biosynthesis
VGSDKTREFLAFLGRRGMPMELGYNTVSVDRIRSLARRGGTSSAEADEAEAAFDARDFVILARLVPKKNLATSLSAYALYRLQNPASGRKLRICGDGPLEGELRAQARALGVEQDVVFHGFLQSEQMAPLLARAAALLLVSREEQFGNVVPEALALGIPLILSDACGARYELLRSGVNGYLVEPDNVAGIADAMWRVVATYDGWQRLREQAHALAHLGDVSRFAEAAQRLVFGQV